MLLIKEMPYKERPRERFLHYGKEAVSTTELIAIILRTGTPNMNVIELARLVMKAHPSIRKINETSVRELTQISGLGEAKAIQLLAALELGKRLYEEAYDNVELISSPTRVYDLMKSGLEMRTQEMFYALYLNTKGCLIKKQLLFVGSLSSAVVHPRELFKYAVTLSAASIILVHNHPSGDPTPSKSDEAITDVMIRNGELMDIKVVDHIIIGKGRYYSFREHKKCFR